MAALVPLLSWDWPAAPQTLSRTRKAVFGESFLSFLLARSRVQFTMEYRMFTVLEF
jgi:hypothetical protein